MFGPPEEVRPSRDPLGAAHSIAPADLYGDGDLDLTDSQKFAAGTHPLVADTDIDRALDGWEVGAATSPVTADSEDLYAYPIEAGDPVVTGGLDRVFHIEYQRRQNAPIRYAVELTTDLVLWRAGLLQEAVQDLGPIFLQSRKNPSCGRKQPKSPVLVLILQKARETNPAEARRIAFHGRRGSGHRPLFGVSPQRTALRAAWKKMPPRMCVRASRGAAAIATKQTPGEERMEKTHRDRGRHRGSVLLERAVDHEMRHAYAGLETAAIKRGLP